MTVILGSHTNFSTAVLVVTQNGIEWWHHTARISNANSKWPWTKNDQVKKTQLFVRSAPRALEILKVLWTNTL